MTSAQRGRGGPKIPQICGHKVHKFRKKGGGGGVKKSQKFADVIYGSPLVKDNPGSSRMDVYVIRSE